MHCGCSTEFSPIKVFSFQRSRGPPLLVIVLCPRCFCRFWHRTTTAITARPSSSLVEFHVSGFSLWNTRFRERAERTRATPLGGAGGALMKNLEFSMKELRSLGSHPRSPSSYHIVSFPHSFFLRCRPPADLSNQENAFSKSRAAFPLPGFVTRLARVLSSRLMGFFSFQRYARDVLLIPSIPVSARPENVPLTYDERHCRHFCDNRFHEGADSLSHEKTLVRLIVLFALFYFFLLSVFFFCSYNFFRGLDIRDD